MSPIESPYFIVNPRASGGMSKRLLRDVELKIKAAFPSGVIRRTKGPGAASDLAQEARRQGIQSLGVVGGDGTINEVINGLLRDGPEGHMPSVALLPIGTGCDLAKSLDVPRNIDKALEIMKAGETRLSDVGRIQCHSCEDSSPMVHYFINIGSFGSSGELVRRVNNSSKRLGGFTSFAIATVTTTVTYKGCNVRVRIDDGEYRECNLNAMIIANGQFQGGGMHSGKGAMMNDGIFKVITIEQRGPIYLVSKLNHLYAGTFELVDGIDVGTARQLEIHPIGHEDVLIEADGEQPGKLPASIEVLEGIIPLCVGPDSQAFA